MMKTKKELGQLNDEQDMLEFFKQYHEPEITMAKLKILHTYHDLIDGVEKLFKKFTKGMTKQQIKEWQQSFDCADWSDAFDIIVADIEKKNNYRLNIEFLGTDEYSVTITNMLDFFWIRYDGSISSEKPKLSEMEKDMEIELTSNAHFLIDLATALVYEHKDLN